MMKQPIGNQIEWRFSQKAYMYVVKRTLDVFFAVLLLVLLSPIMLIIAVAIRLDSRGLAFFTQKRVGKNMRIFRLIKFRSMTVLSSETVDTTKDMVRMTKVGGVIRSLSLDELPQLINIIKGDMSFIGPRPLLVEYMPYYSQEQNKRHLVLPGITGYAQTAGRNSITWEQKFALDVLYAKDISLWMDIKIVFRTIFTVLRRKGVNASGTTTMQKFSDHMRNKTNK